MKACFVCGDCEFPENLTRVEFEDDEYAEGWVCVRRSCRDKVLDDWEAERDGFEVLAARMGPV